MTRFDYALGKALSNFLVLGSMAAILFVVAVVMQFVRGESAAFDLGQIAAPFALVVLPTIAMVAAIALLFEMIPWLRGRAGQRRLLFSLVVVLGLELSVRGEARAMVARHARRKSRHAPGLGGDLADRSPREAELGRDRRRRRKRASPLYLSRVRVLRKRRGRAFRLVCGRARRRRRGGAALRPLCQSPLARPNTRSATPSLPGGSRRWRA